MRNREIPDPPYRHKVMAAVMIGISRGVLPALLAAAPLSILLSRGTGRRPLFAGHPNFGVSTGGEQISIQQIGEGWIGDHGPYSKTPLL